MENKPKTRTEFLLTIMNILAWVAFIGLMVEAGAILISYTISLYNPQGARNVYNGLNLYDLRQFSFWEYTITVSFMAAVSVLKAYVALLLIRILSKVNLVNPFKAGVVRLLEKISYILLGICAIAILHNANAAWLLKRTGISQEEWAIGEFIFMAGLVFIISQVFKRGVEIQSENELTV